MNDEIDDAIEEKVEVQDTGRPVIPITLTARLLAELIADGATPATRPVRETSERRGRARRKGVFVELMSDDERRAYKAELQRERRAAIKAKLDEDNAVIFDAASAREALADAALIILARDLPGAEHVRKYLAGVYRTQPGAPLTLEARIKSGTMRPKLIRYTQPNTT